MDPRMCRRQVSVFAKLADGRKFDVEEVRCRQLRSIVLCAPDPILNMQTAGGPHPYVRACPEFTRQ